MRIQAAKAEEQKRIFGLICGKAGAGKTYQVTSFPKQETLLISVEKGHLTIAGSGYAYCEPASYNELVTFLRTFETKFPHVKYVYIDSLTELYDMVKSEAKEKYTPQQNFAKHDFIQDQMMVLLRMTRNMGISVYFTCHTKRVQDGLTQIEDLAFDGKMPAMVLKQFDFSFHLMDEEEDGKIVRYAVTTPSLSRCAKARVSEFMGITLNNKERANLYQLTRKLLGEKNEN